MEYIEVNCFICGSNNILNGKCMDCGYEPDVEFKCPLHNGSMACRKTHRICTKCFDYYDCDTYKRYG